MIQTLKQLLNTDDEMLLSSIVEICEGEFKDYCNREDVPAAADYVIINMARVQYARLLSQGLNSQSISGVSETFCEDFYPRNLIKQMQRYRKVKLI